jgi:hypothetical protein
MSDCLNTFVEVIMANHKPQWLFATVCYLNYINHPPNHCIAFPV